MDEKKSNVLRKSFSHTSRSSILRKTSSEIKKKRKNPKIKDKYKQKVLKFKTNITEFDIPGVHKLVLSKISQKIIECEIGQNVCIEFPWKNVKKEKIQDNIDLHQLSSEFIPIESILKTYPEEEVLIGYNLDSRAEDVFFIVTTLEAKAQVLEILEEKKHRQEVAVLLNVTRPTKTWFSLGSETEVNTLSLTKLRSLYEQEVTLKFPATRPPEFSSRYTKDARDGYVELLPDTRTNFELINKRSVEFGVQAVKCFSTKEVQTDYKGANNKSTQYEFTYEEKILMPQQINVINKLLYNNINEFDNNLMMNHHFNIHVDDYEMTKLSKRRDRQIKEEFNTNCIIASYVNLNYQRKKYVTDISWDHFRSGIVAVSYTNEPLSLITSSPDVVKLDETNESIFNNWPVMIWSYADDIKPRLLLKSPRQVAILSYCPFLPNLLVGACTNGQVIVWDLTGRLEYLERKEILTPKQLKDRLKIKPLLEWFKPPSGKHSVEPVYISKIHDSHKSRCTGITWGVQHLRYTSIGNCDILDYPNEKSCQFFTSSSGGTIKIWEINFNKTYKVIKKKGRLAAHTELSKNIETLNFNQIDTNFAFKPIYILLFKDPLGSGYKICSIENHSSYMKYSAVIPDPTNNPKIITRYILRTEQKQEPDVRYLAGTHTGQIIDFSWDGTNLIQGKTINTESPEMKLRLIIHDGPVKRCWTNYYFQDIVLTVGGSIWAVWKNDVHTPLMWRKARNPRGKYLSAIWVRNRPNYLLSLRNDGICEWWDFLQNTNCPVKELTFASQRALDIFGGLTPGHCRKSTYIITDQSGFFTVIRTPESFERTPTNDELGNFKDQCLRYIDIKRQKQELIEKLENQNDYEIKRKISNIKIEKSEIIIKKNTEIEKMERIFAEMAYYETQKNVNFVEVLHRKNLKLSEIVAQKENLQRIIKKQEGLDLKLEKTLRRGKEKYENIKNSLLGVDKTRKSNKIYMKTEKHYIQEYDEIEKFALRYIRRHRHDCQSFKDVIENKRLIRISQRSLVSKSSAISRANLSNPTQSCINLDEAEVNTAKFSQDESFKNITIQKLQIDSCSNIFNISKDQLDDPVESIRGKFKDFTMFKSMRFQFTDELNQVKKTSVQGGSSVPSSKTDVLAAMFSC